MGKPSLVPSIVLAALTASLASAQTPVTTCGQVVAGSGVLVADLDCSAGSGIQVSGKLDLAGFTLTGPAADLPAVLCLDRVCRVTGPGMIVGRIVAVYKLKMKDVSVFANQAGSFLASADRMALIATDLSASDLGINAVSKARLVDSSVTGTGALGEGALVGKIVLVRSAITAFGGSGVLAYTRPRLIDSTVTDNGQHPSCLSACVDVASTQFPVLRGTSSCGTSVDLNLSQPWGVCSGD